MTPYLLWCKSGSFCVRPPLLEVLYTYKCHFSGHDTSSWCEISPCKIAYFQHGFGHYFFTHLSARSWLPNSKNAFSMSLSTQAVHKNTPRYHLELMTPSYEELCEIKSQKVWSSTFFSLKIELFCKNLKMKLFLLVNMLYVRGVTDFLEIDFEN